MSYYLFRCGDLLQSLEKVRDANSQREYYLTDCPGVLLAEGKTVRALRVLKPFEALAINTVQELAAVEAAMEELGLPA
jgi:bifunctional UDP-N-acetylglucosamine pyrophosphorylase/glucosamine-1-phosphate N-acetyltransferase/UDP-N-acetylglucosamine pyrophosphorylase